ncbi:hypothetical protein BC351_10420 [Paenibacillus ferrarius]|uniref:Uncharacterized protein n=1 Tax=Paenibacillus ferrarius TaxID=1469647 RepID=A0A1V4HA13_9BACL|nr:hypothetical protein [Paenibacillus ferrarius]OPH47597.1 hypothetical protein BC351_10420 [Paenibacillus ferrarius]
MTINQEDESKSEKESLRKYILNMEVEKVEFKKAVVDYIGVWYEKNARKLITDNEETLKLLDTAILKAFKEDVRKLIENASEYVEKYFDDEKLWWHTNGHRALVFNNSELPSEINISLKALAGELGSVLDRHELILISGSSAISRMENIEQLIQSYEKYDTLTLRAELLKDIINSKEKKIKDNSKVEDNSIGDLWDSL